MTTTPDPAFASRTYPSGPVHTVSAAKIAEFARATGAPSPLHTDPEAARAAGHAGVEFRLPVLGQRDFARAVARVRPANVRIAQVQRAKRRCQTDGNGGV